MPATKKEEVKQKEDNMKALLGVEFRIVGSDLVGIYEKTESGYKILVLPVNQENNNGITIRELLNDVNSLLQKGGTSGEIKENELITQMKAVVPENIKVEEIRVKLKTAFLYINAVEGQDTKTEYAFSLDITTEGVLPQDIKLVDVKKLSVSVWNTERDKIVQTMGLQNADTYLEG